MESSDLQQQRYSTHHLQESHQRQFEPHLKPQFHNTSGLTRFRSAPSSYLGNLMNSIPEPTANTNSDDFHLPRPLSPETESIISRFIHSFSGGSPGTDVVTSEPLHSSNTLCDDVWGSLGMGGMGVMGQAAPLVGISVKHENYEQSGIQQSGKIDDDGSKKNNPSTSPIVYRGQPPSSNKPPLAGGIRSGGGSGNLNSGGMDRLFSPVVMKTGYGGVGGGGLTRSNQRSSMSSLVRHSSSPAGLFDDIHIEKGYLVTQGSGNQQLNYSSKIRSSPFPGSTHSTGGGGGGISGGGGGDRMRNTQTSTNAVPPSHSSGLMMLTKSDHIGEVLLEDKTVKRLKIETSTDDEDNYLSGFPAWDDTNMFSDLLSGGSEREIGGGEVNNPSSENQSPGKARINSVGRGLLAHHMSLPKQRLEKLLEFEDSVPCKIRAKRGCATHPRSIAERVRRTKISERMRKLQDVVPNMDKQTSTADMLDLAVDHIKNLQNQLQMLNGKRARCTCTI